MEVEAALEPPSVRLNACMRKYAIRTFKLAAKHPISQELSNLKNSPTPKLPVQLERIQVSIQNLVDLDDLEPIQHFKFAP